MSPPIKGLGSTFQSPVWSMLPAGVWILNPFGSSIECVSVINSILNGVSSKVLFNWTTFINGVISIFFSLNFSVIKMAVKGVA